MALAFLGSFAITAVAQPKKAPVKAADPVESAEQRSTPAYAEVILRRTEFEAELESLLLDYTEEFPKVKELKFALERANAESGRLTALPPSGIGKATAALGKLMVRKIDAEVEHWKLAQTLADAHPDVKRAKRKIEIFERAIKEILG